MKLAFGRAVDRMNDLLDIRKVVKSNLDVNMFIRRLLTSQQRFLFEKQRERLIRVSEDSPCADSKGDHVHEYAKGRFTGEVKTKKDVT